MSTQLDDVKDFVTSMQAQGATTVAVFVGVPGDMGRVVYAPTGDDMGGLLLIMAQTANELVKAAEDAGQLDAIAARTLRPSEGVTPALLEEYQKTPVAVWPAAHE
jgi:hypothetical protein